MTKRFKTRDRVVLSKNLYRNLLNPQAQWIRSLEQRIEDCGFLVVDKCSEDGIYTVVDFPAISLCDRWLEPYAEDIPFLPLEDGPVYRPKSDTPSLRDQFAMAALMCFRADLFTAPEYVAEKAYGVADAMMEVKAQREKNNG